MSKIIKALKALYEKLGGSASDVAEVNQTPDMINAIAKLDIGGGGSSLPAVTADDNDKVLAVVNGAWDKAEAPSGGSDFVVTYTSGEGDTITADKTFAEITAAIEGGKSVKAVISGQPLILSTVSESAVEFVNVVVNNDIITVNVLAHNDEDTISVRTETAGGSNDFVVTYTEVDGAYTADKTFAEIQAAIEAVKNVRAIEDRNGETHCYYLTFSSSSQICFAYTNFNPSGTTFNGLLHSSDNTVVYA